MDNSVIPNSGFGGSNQRKLMMSTIEGILKKELPKDRDDMTARIMYETGFTENKVREYIKILFRLGYISKDKDNDRLLVWSKK